MNKILIVTSAVTFVPKNYGSLLEELLRLRADDAKFRELYKLKVVFLNNRSPILILKSLFLIISGAPRIGINLLINTLSSYLFDPRKKLLKHHDISFYEFKTPNSVQFRNFLRQEKIDLLINARTRFIYKKKTLHTPKLGALNIHHGILPEYRGTMCDLWAIYEKRDPGFTLHQMNEKIDDGKIILKQVNAFNFNNNYAQYLLESSKAEGKMLFQLIKNHYPEIEKNGIESIAKKNISIQNLPHTKNPTLFEIWKMKFKGIKL